ncbi:MAG: hypothetical protein A2513_06505 [Sulfurimonas sp. RIFOXYD12_FULL_33_39]|uniref:hypothetical protein n=1 Tax=unclassified Sulfurimonas TaxID=2623549 RepID=UPI0008AE4947|nr:MULTISPECIES: hypothetical protein [unclassified Sulfurimonas]OHE10505.1 MAG: hypothetical protein A2513_06505 [Sulfurimonas sp. RIFOXYD12_FULL_33_39]OHE14964.1 MAG: hypothetical protein A2530_00695 [Sulfurimonas sp. RIFOXYD2_FULL_34_21]DAB28254.1 MAG TPA: hypothetical protein CFH78_03585 [Sulfurimonas sp. UBA10385]
MLIYNYKKEFFGIDEDDLTAFGFATLDDFYKEAKDFADLFVKTPGYIHNFAHVHWIDYITCDESGIKPKAIINVKGKNFTTAIRVKTIYLADSPTEKAYIIELSDIVTSSYSQTEKKQTHVTQTPTQKVTLEEPKVQKENVDEIKIPEVKVENKDEYSDLLIKPVQKQHIESKNEPLHEVKKIDDTKVEEQFANYIYNPQVASHELGLPIDLIEEFIQDFIAQAYNFRNGFYDSLNARNLNNLKIQSHKLKGVAANLRIEDALDVLTTINSSDNYEKIATNLDKLYRIIDKLSGKSTVETVQDIVKDTKEDVNDNDDFVLSIKEHDSDISFLYDKKVVADEIGLDLGSFEQLFDEYLKESKEQASSISKLIDENDLTTCKSIATKLKGMSENMRVHILDNDLQSIINAKDTIGLSNIGEDIISKLNILSNIENN